MEPPVHIGSHPLLEVGIVTARFSLPLGEVGPVDALTALLRLDIAAPLSSDEAVRGAVRDLLRHAGYKPTGRGKPASEYLLRAVGEGALSSINAMVDACNVASLHSGLPISVVDLEQVELPLEVAVAPAGTSYVFNASEQVIDVSRLLCLFDAKGACANAVKDSQRTKTSARTTRTLSVIWGTKALAGRTAAAVAWYRQLLSLAGAATESLVAPA
jgi:DNA/RNA-binding domain of Phe-tRNA-synthetase-like protein